jgi:uncharacterized protein YukE
VPAEDVVVTPAVLVEHAARIDAAAGEIATAGQAGQSVRVDRGAYGQLCTFVPVMIDGLQGLVVDAIDAAADSLRDTADRLRSAATGYRDTDQNRERVNARLRAAL